MKTKRQHSVVLMQVSNANMKFQLKTIHRRYYTPEEVGIHKCADVRRFRSQLYSHFGVG